MTATGWSLSSELQKIAMAASLREATLVLGIVSAASRTYRIVESEWYAAGSDVYVLDFDVFCDGSLTGSYVVKASASLADWSENVVDSWNLRRAAVARAGVEVPHLVGVGRGLVIEERVPYSLSEAMPAGAPRPEMVKAFGRTVRRLVDAGFRPLSCETWRSRGDDVVVADFGYDLGGPAIRNDNPESYIRNLLRGHLDLIGSGEDWDLLLASALKVTEV